MSFESNIFELNGYLKALQRLCGSHFSFGACHFIAEDDVNMFVDKLIKKWSDTEEYVYEGVSLIEYGILAKHFELFVFNGILDRQNMLDNNVRSYATKLIVEDINEYYGLAATSVNFEIFHPLISGPVYKLNIINRRYDDSLYFLVKIEKYFVLTYFRHRVKS